MIKVNSFLLLIALSFTLASCGLKPLYNLVNSQFNNIKIANIEDRNGQVLRNFLLTYFKVNDNDDYDYLLQIEDLNEFIIGIDTSIRSDITREQIHLKLKLKLIDLNNNQELLNRSFHKISSYNIFESQNATRVSKENVSNHLLKQLAEDILKQVSIYLVKSQTGNNES